MRSFLWGAAITAHLFALETRAQVVDPQAARTIRTSKAEVLCLAIAPKGDRILVGLTKGAELYDILTGKRVHAFPYEEDGSAAVWHVAFNDNGEQVLLMGHTGKRVVYEVKKGEKIPITTGMRWLPDPRAVKAMGFDMKNSTFDRFYQQTEAADGDLIMAAVKNGGVEVRTSTGEVLQTITFPENKDQHHRAPIIYHDGQFILGTDDGRVVFHTVL